MDLTSNDAFWILAHLPMAAPFGQDEQWMKRRNEIAIKLEAIRHSGYEPAVTRKPTTTEIWEWFAKVSASQPKESPE